MTPKRKLKYKIRLLLPVTAIIHKIRNKKNGFDYFRLGIFPYTRNSPEKVKKYIHNVVTHKKETELIKITKRIRQKNNHSYYNAILKKMVPKWNIHPENPIFIGDNGRGSGSLNTYRMIDIKGKTFFEKIYFKSHQNIENIRHFQEVVYPLIEKEIAAPQIKYFYEGPLLVITYSEYMELVPYPPSEIESHVIQLSKELYKISANYKINTKLETLPSTVRDYKKNARPIKNFKLARAKLNQSGIDTQLLEKRVQQSKRVLTHGSIHNRNVLQGRILIDWDKLGYYPLGFEQAYLYYRLLPIKEKTRKRDKSLIGWLKLHFGDTVSPDDWQDFELNFMYFLLAYGTEYFKKNNYKKLENELIKNIGRRIHNLHEHLIYI